MGQRLPEHAAGIWQEYEMAAFPPVKIKGVCHAGGLAVCPLRAPCSNGENGACN
jgi:hypothetical protein